MSAMRLWRGLSAVASVKYDSRRGYQRAEHPKISSTGETPLILVLARRCRRRGDPLAMLRPHLFDQRLEVRHAIYRRNEDCVTDRNHGDILEADRRH